MAEFMDEAVEDIAADIGLVRLGIMKPLTDADLSPRARWFQDHYGCLMDLRTYPLDFPFMSDSDRAVLEQFHTDLKSGKIREEDIP